MINQTFQTLHLQQRKIVTPLFKQAKQAFIGQYHGHKFHSKYLVIESNKEIPGSIFRDGHVCPIFINGKRSYIFQEGESLYYYFLSKKDTDMVLCQEEIWRLLSQIGRALVTLRNQGFQHRNIKEYAIRRVSPDLFKLIYHPSMNSMQSLIESKSYKWHQFYLAPEQLADLTLQASNSCIFSLGAMVLNIMNPLDFNRDIYSKKQYQLNQDVLKQKLDNAAKIYSGQLMKVVRKMLIQNYEQRQTLDEMIQMIDEINPIPKKSMMTSNIRNFVTETMSRHRERSKTPSQQKLRKSGKERKINDSVKVINFERGTFGGYQEDSDLDAEKQLSSGRIQSDQKKESQKTLKKNQSEKIDRNSQITNSRSYSQYFTTAKKDKESPLSMKMSEIELKVPSTKIELNKSVQVEDSEQINQTDPRKYNEYIESVQEQRKVKIELSQPKKWLKKKKEQAIKINDSISNSNISQKSINKDADVDLIKTVPLKMKQSLSYTNSQMSNTHRVEEEDLENTLQLFKSRIEQNHIKLSQCLEEPSRIARKLDYQGVWIDGNVYYGEFKNGRRTGLALEVFENNQYYYGHYKDDMFHGDGFYFWNNSQHFLGVFQAGKKKEGTWLGKNRYEGEIKDNRRHGVGTYRYSNGVMYEGEWFEGKRHGFGIIIEPPGDKFMGTFCKGKKQGHGTYLINNCRFIGKWDGQLPVGPIQVKFPEGRYYKGEINDNFQMHGQGELTFSNGSHCKGTFFQDKLIKGQMFYRNGQHYQGQFRDNSRHGRGIYTYTGGKRVQGQWHDNVFVEANFK